MQGCLSVCLSVWDLSGVILQIRPVEQPRSGSWLKIYGYLGTAISAFAFMVLQAAIVGAEAYA